MARKWNTKSRIIAAIRQISRWYPAKKEALSAAKCIGGGYMCASCRRPFPPKDVQVDHIIPAICPEMGWQGYDAFVARLFCDPKLLQVLCRKCHQKKSLEENARRREVKARGKA